MPQRSVVLANNEIYHIFNRSIAGENILAPNQKANLNKAFEIVNYYRYPQKLRLSRFKILPLEFKKQYLDMLKTAVPLVEIYVFAFMPNHFHFLLKQIQDRGIARFIANFQNSFAKVFNLKNDRNGALFQNAFKAKRIITEEQCTHVSRYIHLNPVTAYLIEFNQLSGFEWTSFPAYAKDEQIPFVNTEFLLKMFGSKEKYLRFVEDQVNYQRQLALIKNLMME